MMDSQRNIILVAFLLVCFLVWQTWEQDKAPKPVPKPSATQSQLTQQNANLLESTDSHQDSQAAGARNITIKTDVLDLVINTKGGDIEQAGLIKYTKTLNSPDPLLLLRTTPSFVYQAQSGLIGRNGLDNLSPKDGYRAVYSTTQDHYELKDGQDELKVPLVYRTSNGIVYTKTFVLKRGQYDVSVEYTVKNPTDSLLSYNLYGKLKQNDDLPAGEQHSSGLGGIGALHVYRGAAYSTQDTKYKKYSFSDIADRPLDLKTKGGWVAMLQQYFATAWIPPTSTDNNFYTRQFKDAKQSEIGFISSEITVQPRSTHTFGARLWVGPELQSQMAAVSPHLDLSVDYGWLWFISKYLFMLLEFIQGYVSNWGIAIIIITFIVRGVMYPLTRAQYTSMAKMKLLQPRIQAMKERLGDDRQRVSQEMMALYKQEKVNPLGGCLPIVIQMPIFLALYYMLSASVELRHAPFFFWLHDLSAQDPYYILPIIMGCTMYLIQKMSPTPVADPMQQKMMTFMPVIFTIFFLWFPAGLVLYYIVSNLVTITQQQLIYRGLEKRGLHTRKKNKK